MIHSTRIPLVGGGIVEAEWNGYTGVTGITITATDDDNEFLLSFGSLVSAFAADDGEENEWAS